jgi:hypothetical protein
MRGRGSYFLGFKPRCSSCVTTSNELEESESEGWWVLKMQLCSPKAAAFHVGSVLLIRFLTTNANVKICDTTATPCILNSHAVFNNPDLAPLLSINSPGSCPPSTTTTPTINGGHMHYTSHSFPQRREAPEVREFPEGCAAGLLYRHVPRGRLNSHHLRPKR